MTETLPAAPPEPPLLEMRGITKSFAGNTVLADVNLTARAGATLAVAEELEAYGEALEAAREVPVEAPQAEETPAPPDDEPQTREFELEPQPAEAHGAETPEGAPPADEEVEAAVAAEEEE